MMGTTAADIIKRLSFSSVSPASARSSTMSNANISTTSAIFLSSAVGNTSQVLGTSSLQVSAMAAPILPNGAGASAPAIVAAEGSKVQVCLRMKPCDAKVETIKLLDDTKVRAIPPPGALPTFKTTEYSFSKVFGPDATQTEIFEHVARPLVSGLLESGKDGLIFAYGVTNSGKTFTVEGNKESPGLIPQTLQCIFKIAPHSVVYVSYLQIYNDQVHDLQESLPQPTATDPVPPQRKNLKVKLREDRVVVEGLKETRVTSLSEGMAILDRGRENRAISDNSINHNSSRSHTVFIVRVGQSKLHIVDLAGSERGKRTKATGARQVEASNINLSLSQLMQCLDAMRANQKLARLYPDKPRDKPPFRQIPFRDCKLTMLFRDCLRGRNSAGVVMVVNASPEPNDFEETTQALRYGEMTRSTAIEASTAATNLLNMAAAVAGARYDYNGRLIRGGMLEGLEKVKANETVKFAVNEVEEERVVSDDEAENRPLVPAGIAPKQMHSPMVSSTRLQPSPLLVRSALKNAIAFASPKCATPSDSLADENDQLKRELADCKASLVTLEIQIRNELASEMAEKLKEMEERYTARLARAQSFNEETMDVLQHKSAKKQPPAPTMDDVRVLVDQVTECEEEIKRMREKHKRDLEALQTELNNARRAQIEASLQQQTVHQQVKPVPSTPWMVAEERKRVDRLLKDLETERNAHRHVIIERAELQDAYDRLITEHRGFKDREESMQEEIQRLKDHLDSARGTIVTQEKQLQQWRSKVASPQQCSAQLSGIAPHLLLSKRRNKENNDFNILRSKENNEPLNFA